MQENNFCTSADRKDIVRAEESSGGVWGVGGREGGADGAAYQEGAKKGRGDKFEARQDEVLCPEGLIFDIVGSFRIQIRKFAVKCCAP